MVFSSPYPDVEIPNSDVYKYVFGGIDDTEMSRIALVDATTGAQTSYRELLKAIDAFAGGLAERRVGVGDVVGLLAPNSTAFVVAFHGILRAGATATSINALFTPNDIAKQLTDSHARMLITAAHLLDGAERAAAEVGLSDADIVVLDGPRLEHNASGKHPHAADLLAAARPAPHVDFDPATHLAVLPYSSGTTGDPKGVMLTHRNLVANVAQIQPIQPITAHDIVLAVIPFFHIYGMTALLNSALHTRSRLVIMSAFDLNEFLATIEAHQCTVAFVAPPVVVALANHPLVDSYDLSSLRIMMSGAAPLDGAVGHAAAERLGCRIVQGYGMSELSPVSHCIPSDGGQQALGKTAPLSSCGWTVPNAQSKIVDPETGAEIGIPIRGRSANGELWFKGPNVMAGYLSNEQSTAQTIDAEGFLHTGDLACVDADGCVYIVDRLKELIKYKGHQVPPAELEALLLSHQSIADAAVIGVPDELGQEIPKAFVVQQSGEELTEAEVMDYVATRVAPYKKVRRVEFIDAVPRSPAGKILRRDLKARN
jgi:acyl-CoA synthetase (AMP-forming)/AMP-acid ligase II